MVILRDIPALKDWLKTIDLKSLAFIPTMGNLHAGHLLLMELAQQKAQYRIVSIFVNPLQFDKAEDLKYYPRTETQDIAQLKQINIDAVFIPTVAMLYPQGLEASTQIIPPHHLTNKLCGSFRPGHFIGVATIVSKLLHLIPSAFAVFGEKDWQQLIIIKQMIADLNFDTHILQGKTVREIDGLALSSRNQKMTIEERKIAKLLYETLHWAVIETQKQSSHAWIEQTAIQQLLQAGFQIEYFNLYTQTLNQATSQDKALIWLAAVWLGNTRLIDNIPFSL